MKNTFRISPSHKVTFATSVGRKVKTLKKCVGTYLGPLEKSLFMTSLWVYLQLYRAFCLQLVGHYYIFLVFSLFSLLQGLALGISLPVWRKQKPGWTQVFDVNPRWTEKAGMDWCRIPKQTQITPFTGWTEK